MKNGKIGLLLGTLFALSLCGCSGEDSMATKDAMQQTAESGEESTDNNEASSQAESTADAESQGAVEETAKEVQTDPSEDFKTLLVQESGRGQDDIRFFDMDDFDKDGELEAFALVGDEPDYDFDEKGLVEGNVWFVNGGGAKKLTEGFGMGIRCQDRLLDFGSKKYIVFGDVYATGEMSYAFEVKGKAVSEAAFSRRGTVQEQEADSFRIVDSSYDAELDPSIDGLLGHTWKSYYFYYDKESDSVKEYGGLEISEEKAKELAGHDFTSECLQAGDEPGKIYYRRNGLININYSRPGSDGCVSYLHRTWNIENGCYIDDYAEKSDEEQSGTYLAELCPEIAVYPE